MADSTIQALLDDLKQRHALSPEVLSDIESLLHQVAAQRPSVLSSMAEGSPQVTLVSDSLKDLPDTVADSSTADEPPLARFVPGDRYEDLGLLGVGGMGTVRRVLDRDLNRTMAMKILHSKLRKHSGEIARFIEEAQATAQLQHPGIVPVHEMGCLEDGRFYFTMQEIRGRTLGEVIAHVHDHSEESWQTTPGGWSFRRLVDAFRRLCEAVAYAHERGVVHRDLKPDNVMVGEHGEVLVVDWGLAKVVGRPDRAAEAGELDPVVTDRSKDDTMHTRMGAVAGTPAYMPPEQARGEVDRIDARSDVYALGAILYEILSGQPPYVGLGVEAVLDKVLAGAPLPPDRAVRGGDLFEPLSDEDAPPSPEVTGPLIPEELVATCLTAMAREPEQRFADVSSLAAEVVAWLNGERRHEQALAVVEKAQAKRVELRALRASAVAFRTEAREQFEADVQVAWASLEEARQATSSALDLARAAQRQLQAALVFDPSLPEAHRALAESYAADGVRARAEQDDRRAMAADVLRDAHHQALPASDPLRRAFEDRMARDAQHVLPPMQGVPLMGRSLDLEALGAWWSSPGRLLTMVGAAGSGKTRLASHFARSIPSGRAVFCSLAEAHSAGDIVRSVAAMLDLRLTQKDSLAQVSHALRGLGPTLLVADNLEQVIPHLGETLGRWLEMAPALRVLATSRTRLGLTGEATQAVAPLEGLSAAEMFEQVAKLSRPGFQLGAHNFARVLEVVASLDYLPLAIELAAARMGALGLDGIREWLSDRFALLRGRLRDPGSRALEGALEASWSLLSGPEQGALAACSVFRGGWTLDAARAVLDTEEPPVLDVLDALVEDHLVVRVTERGATRYRLLESIREYGAQKLGSATDATALRHAKHFAFFASDAFCESLESHGGVERLDELSLDLENLLAGIDAGLAADDGETAAGCTLAAEHVFFHHGPIADALVLLQRVSVLPVSRETQGRLVNSIGRILIITGRAPEGLEHVDQAIAIAREIGNRTHEGQALSQLGVFRHAQGRLSEAEEHLEQALQAHRGENHPQEVGRVLGRLGNLLRDQGRIPEALEHWNEGLEIAREVGYRHLEGVLLANLSSFYLDQGRIPEALEHFDEAIGIAREVGNRRNEGIMIGNLGDILLGQGELTDAEANLEQAIAICDEVHVVAANAFRGSLALLRARQGSFDEARALLAEGEPHVRSYLVEHGKLLCKKARIEHLASNPEAAATALAEAEAIASEIQGRSESELGQAIAEVRELLSSGAD